MEKRRKGRHRDWRPSLLDFIGDNDMDTLSKYRDKLPLMSKKPDKKDKKTS